MNEMVDVVLDTHYIQFTVTPTQHRHEFANAQPKVYGKPANNGSVTVSEWDRHRQTHWNWAIELW